MIGFIECITLKIPVRYILLAMSILLNGCHPLKPFSDIDTSDAVKLIKSGGSSTNTIILDVRTPEEFATGYIAGAVNLDFKSPEFARKLDTQDRTKTYIVYCRSGGRSAKAMTMMKEKGFSRVYNLKGGILFWKEKGLPLQGE